MSDPFATNEEVTPAKSNSPKLLQFSVLTIMLLTAAVGVWVAQIQTANQTEQMQLEIPDLKEAARELIITDPDQYAVVRHHETWKDDFRWRIYLPEGHQYQLALATEEIDGQGFTVPINTKIMEPGEYELELQYDKHPDNSYQFAVLLDGEIVLEQQHAAGWIDSSASSDGSSISSSTQRKFEVPLEIMRRRFYERQANGSSRAPQGPAKGVLIWLDTVD